MFRVLAYLLLFFSLVACGSSGPSARHASMGNNIKVDTNQGTDLTDFLRRLSGVQVNGQGANASVMIRGVGSINSPNEPLFVVDGVALGTSYSEIYGSINPQDIDRISVLKNAGQTGIYGVRGGNGVIEITLKKAVADDSE